MVSLFTVYIGSTTVHRLLTEREITAIRTRVRQVIHESRRATKMSRGKRENIVKEMLCIVRRIVNIRFDFMCAVMCT